MGIVDAVSGYGARAQLEDRYPARRVAFPHCGAFENWPLVLASLSARGYIVASVNYRLSGEAAWA